MAIGDSVLTAASSATNLRDSIQTRIAAVLGGVNVQVMHPWLSLTATDQ